MATDHSLGAEVGQRDHVPAARGQPHAALHGVVVAPYSGYDGAAASHGGFVMPAGMAVPLVIKVRDSALRPPTFVTGPRESFTVVEGACAPSFLEVWLPPLAAYTVLGVPLDRLGGSFVDLIDVLGAEGRRLGERVQEAASWTARWRHVDRFLLRQVTRGPVPAPEVAEAWELLRRSGGRQPIGQVAATVGWSHKHLIDRFREQLGVLPKTAARLARFQQARRRREAGTSWGQVAAEAGYFDQAHLIRDFRQFTGLTPTRLAG